METINIDIRNSLIRDRYSKVVMHPKSAGLLPQHLLVASADKLAASFSIDYKFSAYYEEYTPAMMLGIYSRSCWLDFCKAGLIKIHDLMWGKTSSVATAMMTGNYKGEPVASHCLWLWRGHFLNWVLSSGQLRRNGTYYLGGPYLRFCATGKNFFMIII